MAPVLNTNVIQKNGTNDQSKPENLNIKDQNSNYKINTNSNKNQAISSGLNESINSDKSIPLADQTSSVNHISSINDAQKKSSVIPKHSISEPSTVESKQIDNISLNTIPREKSILDSEKTSEQTTFSRPITSDIDNNLLNYSKSSTESIAKTESKNKSTFLLEAINILPIRFVEGVFKNTQKINITRPVISLNNETNTPSKDILKLAFEIGSGINIWNGNYKSNDVMNDYTTKQLGYVYGINSVLAIPSWEFNLGYQYQYLNELLDYNKVTKVPVHFENIVIKKNIDAYTDGSNDVYGDTIVMRDRTRKIVQYNTIKMHSIHLDASRIFNFSDRISAGLGLGIQYNFRTQLEGISLDQQEEHNSYDQVGTNNLGVRTRVSLRYQLNSKWMLKSSLSMQQYISDFSIDQNKVSSPRIFNLGLGLRYSF